MNSGFEKEELPVLAYNVFEECVPEMRTEDQFRTVVDSGVNLLYGFNGEDEFLLSMCKKYRVRYLLKRPIFEEYVAEGGVAFSGLTEEEKCKLDEKLRRELKKYLFEEMCSGIAFRDEPGVTMFPGIARAKAVFDEMNSGKLFYVNQFPYYISAESMQFGSEKFNLKADIPELSTDFPNNRRYEYFIRRFIREVKPALLSFDAYPFQTLAGAGTAVHEALYELNQFYHEIENETGIPFWSFLQCGGRWEGALDLRVPTHAEVMLNVSIPLLYGAKGLELFPFHFPSCWKDPDAVAGMTDRNGRPTDLYYDFRFALRQAKEVAKDLLQGKLLGIFCTGKYSGLLPSEKTLKGKLYNETIFRGKLSPFYSCELPNIKGVKIHATSQLLVGEFQLSRARALFAVNSSNTCALRAEFEFAHEVDLEIVEGGARRKERSKRFSVNCLGAGENILIIGR